MYLSPQSQGKEVQLLYLVRKDAGHISHVVPYRGKRSSFSSSSELAWSLSSSMISATEGSLHKRSFPKSNDCCRIVNARLINGVSSLQTYTY